MRQSQLLTPNGAVTELHRDTCAVCFSWCVQTLVSFQQEGLSGRQKCKGRKDGHISCQSDCLLIAQEGILVFTFSLYLYPLASAETPAEETTVLLRGKQLFKLRCSLMTLTS